MIFRRIIYINTLFFGTYHFFLPMEGVTVSDIFNLIVTCFETIRLILAGIFNVLHNNFKNEGIFNIHMRKPDLKTDLKVKGGYRTKLYQDINRYTYHYLGFIKRYILIRLVE